MTDSDERVVVNFGDVELSDVCLVVGNTDFNVHKMTLACRSSYFKTMFFGDFKEKNEKRITIEADPAPFKNMLEILYDAICANEDFFKCGRNFPEVFWKEGAPLWELLDRYDVQVRWKYFEKNLNRYICPVNRQLYVNRAAAQFSSTVSICSNCVLRKLFAMQNGINLEATAFDSSSLKTAAGILKAKNYIVDGEVFTKFISSFMYLGLP